MERNMLETIPPGYLRCQLPCGTELSLTLESMVHHGPGQPSHTPNGHGPSPRSSGALFPRHHADGGRCRLARTAARG